MDMHPTDDIEMRNTMANIGQCAYHMFKGAEADGASEKEAFLVICAWYVAQFFHPDDDDDTDD